MSMNYLADFKKLESMKRKLSKTALVPHKSSKDRQYLSAKN